jgi:two-component system, NtrC family, nitrogen regulation response regulator NtrX
MADPMRLAPPRPRFGPRAVELVGRSAAIRRVQEFLGRAAGTDGGVLIVAEAGSAPEAIARELHARSRHATGPFVAIECAALDPARLDRTLFGVTAEAAAEVEPVTADSAVASAHDGFLFLQDVTELPAAAQARLARIARDGEVSIGRTRVETRCRLVASASPGVEADVDARRFRVDLYRRVSAVRIDVPPLRERREDLPPLAIRLLEDICASRGITPRTFTQAALALVSALAWPGNLKELHGAVEHAVSETHDDVIQIEHLLPALRLDRPPEPFAPARSLREARLRFERDYIASVLQHYGWHMANAAQALGIQRPNLYRKARQLGIPLARAADEVGERP